jgi:hypothetical protein
VAGLIRWGLASGEIGSREQPAPENVPLSWPFHAWKVRFHKQDRGWGSREAGLVNGSSDGRAGGSQTAPSEAAWVRGVGPRQTLDRPEQPLY